MNTSNSRKRLSVKDRRKKVAELLLAGSSYREIAHVLSVSLGTIAKDAAAVAAMFDDDTAETAVKYKTLELKRLDRLWLSHWKKALAGDVQATGQLLRIMERRAKLLGLDAPAKINIHQLDDETLMRLISELEDGSAETPES